jgi:peptidoglycan/xylan/chitin deacetylase (PgdA/CDA1 family)
VEAIRSSPFVRKNMAYLCGMSDYGIRMFLTDFQKVALQPMLSWEDILFMRDRGFSFGSHSCSHPFLPDLSEAELLTELSESQARIAETTGDKVDFFCYPYSASSDRIKRVLLLSNYLAAFEGGQVPCERFDEPFAIPRVLVTREVPAWEFKFYFSRGFNWYSTVMDSFRSNLTRRA